MKRHFGSNIDETDIKPAGATLYHIPVTDESLPWVIEALSHNQHVKKGSVKVSSNDDSLIVSYIYDDHPYPTDGPCVAE